MGATIAATPITTGRASATPAAATRPRLQSIDALRGLVMVVMLLDHVRETWFLHVPVADPIDAHTAPVALLIARLLVSICAPVFVALTGLGVYLYRANHTLAETTHYLLTRGLILMAFDVLYLSELYWGITTPTLWLQVIWCIGVCMIVLAALIRLPHRVLIAIGLVIVCGHNLLDPIRFQPGDPLFIPWALLHQRDAIVLPIGLTLKTTYPVLAWIGVILLGYGIGPWFLPNVDIRTRQRRLLRLGVAMLLAFVALRAINVYGDKPWFVVADSPVRTVMSFLSMTKYPPSLLFLLPTLGTGVLLLVACERFRDARITPALAVFGAAPMFFYLFHLTMLRILYHGALAIFGPNQGTVFGVGNYGWVLLWYVALIVPLYIPTVWFSRLKKRRRDITWLKYF
ncbi:DUF1624 domain-containing protein [Sphingomonas phyllosphaerae]|uniref:DUF1624 domain-containing protein n=1 Tax=Sphingomonas phyllosphaerae TaxID=257003 RepID=UPI000410C7C4|nr:heparan-alpha-glucosaminide N-acetyltransferase domain-containing protein [Sphingomonas phyllosphaerae]